MTDHPIPAEAILVRTEEGQRRAFDDIQLDGPHRRLLRLANGYTPLGCFVARLDPGHDWFSTAKALIEQRLVDIEPRAQGPGPG